MKSRPLMRRGWLMVLCVALASAAGWWTYREIGSERLVVSPEQVPVEALSGLEDTVSETLSLIQTKPAAMKALPSVHEVDAMQNALLPDAQLALVDQLELLVPLARDGNPTATCRLHLAAARCRTVENRAKRARREQRDLEQRLDGFSEIPDRTWLLEQAQASLAREQAALEWCKGVDLDALPDTQGMSEKALPGMNTWQRVLLVMTRPDGTLMRLWQHPMRPESHDSTAGYLYPQFLSDHAYSILQAGLAEANPLALEGLIRIHAPVMLPDSHEMPMLLMPDRDAFVRYAFLMQATHGDDALGPVMNQVLMLVLSDLSGEDRERLQQWADKAARHWMSSARASGRDGLKTSLEHEPNQLCSQ